MLVTKLYFEEVVIPHDFTFKTGVTGLKLIKVPGRLTIPSGIFVGALKIKASTIIIEPEAIAFASISADHVRNYGRIVGNVKVAETFHNYWDVEGDIKAVKACLFKDSCILGSLEADTVEHSSKSLVTKSIKAREIIEKEIPFLGG